jgi:hypothetical protein
MQSSTLITECIIYYFAVQSYIALLLRLLYAPNDTHCAGHTRQCGWVLNTPPWSWQSSGGSDCGPVCAFQKCARVISIMSSFVPFSLESCKEEFSVFTVSLYWWMRYGRICPYSSTIEFCTYSSCIRVTTVFYRRWT